jgi:hypothetical protein
MYFVSAYELDQTQVGLSDDPGFVVQFLRKSRNSKNFTDDPGEQGSAWTVKKNSTEVFSLDDKGYLFCAKSKGALKDCLKSKVYQSMFETSGAQISALFNEYKADAETKKAYANAMAKAKEQKNKKGSPFSITEFSVKEIFQELRIQSKKDFRQNGYAMVIARSDWFSPTAKGQTRLMGDSHVSGATIAAFTM